MKRRNKLLPAYYRVELQSGGEGGRDQGERGLNPPSELRSADGSSRNAPKSRRGPDPIGTTFRAGSTVVIKRLGDMPDGPRRARLSADPRASL